MSGQLVVNAGGRVVDVPEYGTSKIEFPDKKHPTATPVNLMEVMIAASDLRKETDTSQHEATVDIRTSLPWIALTFTGDWHIGNEHTNYRLFDWYMKKVEDTQGLFMMVVGDERDNFVIKKFLSGLFEAVASPQEQAEYVRLLLKRLDDKRKLLARCGGNHNSWTWSEAGIDLERTWYKEMNSPLLNEGGFIHLKVNAVEYCVYIHHGKSLFNSNFNPNHATKRAFEFQGPYDIAAMGHTHVSESAHGFRLNDSFQKDYVQLRTGTFKQDDPYARAMQLGRGQPPGATVLLSASSKRMMPFIKLQDALDVLEALNG
jgi:hypothetical protein